MSFPKSSSSRVSVVEKRKRYKRKRRSLWPKLDLFLVFFLGRFSFFGFCHRFGLVFHPHEKKRRKIFNPLFKNNNNTNNKKEKEKKNARERKRSFEGVSVRFKHQCTDRRTILLFFFFFFFTTPNKTFQARNVSCTSRLVS
jgi:hypothetical protein|tara:strand:- start:876 stop:1298 length:423 start_codon:yes stop_codon:yes gene_type:complete